MTSLTPTELRNIHGGWDWYEFTKGLGVGIAIAGVAVATGGGALVGEAAILAWAGVGTSLVCLYL